MGRLVPAGTGMEYYRRVKIAGEDVIEKSRWSNQGLEEKASAAGPALGEGMGVPGEVSYRTNSSQSR